MSEQLDLHFVVHSFFSAGVGFSNSHFPSPSGDGPPHSEQSSTQGQSSS